MLPNLSIPSLTIYGPLKIHPFGVLVALALIIGYQIGISRARKNGLDLQIFADAGIWAIAVGFLVSHLFWAILYNHHLVKQNPLILLMVWKGISSYGGFFGGAFGAWIYLRRKGIPSLDYFAVMPFGVVPAWIIARLGCTIAFDHPGRTTTFFLGMADSAGVVRHNLGFYEMLWTAVIAAILYSFRNYRPFRAFHVTLIFLLYAPVRFFFDSLRVGDRTYGGFTPGQYFSVLVTGIGIYLLVRGLKEKSRVRSPESRE
jgi:phosphatidylglycerol:prolipoprotein diacylglycerol transferase